MVEHIERIWSSNIGDWESYWVDRDFFQEHYGNLEEDPESAEFSREELNKMQEDQITEVPDFIEWLLEQQDEGWTIGGVGILKEEGANPMDGDMAIYLYPRNKVEITKIVVQLNRPGPSTSTRCC